MQHRKVCAFIQKHFFSVWFRSVPCLKEFLGSKRTFFFGEKHVRKDVIIAEILSKSPKSNYFYNIKKITLWSFGQNFGNYHVFWTCFSPKKTDQFCPKKICMQGTDLNQTGKKCFWINAQTLRCCCVQSLLSFKKSEICDFFNLSDFQTRGS